MQTFQKDCGCQMTDINNAFGDWIGIDQKWCAEHSKIQRENFMTSQENKGCERCGKIVGQFHTCRPSHLPPNETSEGEVLRDFDRLWPLNTDNRGLEAIAAMGENEHRAEIRDFIAAALLRQKASIGAKVLNILEENRGETLWGDDGSNDIMKISIENFIVAIRDDILAELGIEKEI